MRENVYFLVEVSLSPLPHGIVWRHAERAVDYFSLERPSPIKEHSKTENKPGAPGSKRNRQRHPDCDGLLDSVAV